MLVRQLRIFDREKGATKNVKTWKEFLEELKSAPKSLQIQEHWPRMQLTRDKQDFRLSDARDSFVILSTLDRFRLIPWLADVQDSPDSALLFNQEPRLPMVPKTNGHTVMALDATSGTLYSRQLSLLDLNNARLVDSVQKKRNKPSEATENENFETKNTTEEKVTLGSSLVGIRRIGLCCIE